MKLGVFISNLETIWYDGQYHFDESAELLVKEGIKNCGFFLHGSSHEGPWREVSVQLKKTLDRYGISLNEYCMSHFIMPLNRDECEKKAQIVADCLEITENAGCLNVVASAGGFAGDGTYTFSGYCPHIKNHSQEAWDLMYECCEMIADKAEKRHLNARLTIEPCVPSIMCSTSQLKKLVESIGSKNIQAHLDLINVMDYEHIYDNKQYIIDNYQNIRGLVQGAHIKDIAPVNHYIMGLEEVVIGKGFFDFDTYLSCITDMPEDTAVLIEHLSNYQDVVYSYNYLKNNFGKYFA